MEFASEFVYNPETEEVDLFDAEALELPDDRSRKEKKKGSRKVFSLS